MGERLEQQRHPATIGIAPAAEYKLQFGWCQKKVLNEILMRIGGPKLWICFGQGGDLAISISARNSQTEPEPRVSAPRRTGAQARGWGVDRIKKTAGGLVRADTRPVGPPLLDQIAASLVLPPLGPPVARHAAPSARIGLRIPR